MVRLNTIPGYYLQYNISNSKLNVLRLSSVKVDDDYESLIGSFGITVRRIILNYIILLRSVSVLVSQ